MRPANVSQELHEEVGKFALVSMGKAWTRKLKRSRDAESVKRFQ